MSGQTTAARPRSRRVLRSVAVLAVALVVGALLVRVSCGYALARQLDNELARIRTAGEPLTFGDLAADSPPVGEADDAGRFYEAALALSPQNQPEVEDLRLACRAQLEATLGTVDPEPSSTPMKGAEDLLAHNSLALDMLRRGAECPACGMDMGIEQSMQFGACRLIRARGLARLLSLEACLEVLQGDGDQAADSVTCWLRMLRMFDRQPVLLVSATRAVHMELACKDAEVVMGLCAPSDAALARLQVALLEADASTSLERMALTERVYGIESVQNLLAASLDPRPAGDGLNWVPRQQPVLGWWSRPWALQYCVRYLREMGEFVSTAGKPWDDAIAILVARYPTQRQVDRGWIPGPALTRVVVHSAHALAVARCTAVAVMIERYRRANGGLPSSLADLVPTYCKVLPSDPFTGKPLLYRRDQQSYTIYSVGRNGADDAGDVAGPSRYESGESKPRDAGIRICPGVIRDSESR